MATDSSKPNFAHLLPPSWEEEVQRWIRADIPKFDIGGFVVGDTVRVAKILGKSPGILCGKPFVDCIFEYLGCKVTWLRDEGHEITEDQAKAKAAVAHVEGPCRNLLMGERTALNLMARASGIATKANNVSKLVRAKGWHGAVAATRKTTPGFALVEILCLSVGPPSHGFVEHGHAERQSRVEHWEYIRICKKSENCCWTCNKSGSRMSQFRRGLRSRWCRSGNRNAGQLWTGKVETRCSHFQRKVPPRDRRGQRRHHYRYYMQLYIPTRRCCQPRVAYARLPSRGL